MKRLSERVYERLKRLEIPNAHLMTPMVEPSKALRLCPSCETHKPYKMPYWELGKRKCRHCDKWSRFGR